MDEGRRSVMRLTKNRPAIKPEKFLVAARHIMTVPHTRIVTPTNFLIGKRWARYVRKYPPDYVARGVTG
jgi:hypothetical protein